MTADGRARLRYPAKPFLNEFLLETDYPVDTLIDACMAHGILPGVKVDDHAILMAATEMQTREDIDRLVEIAKSCK
jgi:glycine cleavage system pyridoxal-binding protein P